MAIIYTPAIGDELTHVTGRTYRVVGLPVDETGSYDLPMVEITGGRDDTRRMLVSELRAAIDADDYTVYTEGR